MYYVPQEKRKTQITKGKTPERKAKMMNFNLNTTDKKILVSRLGELTGIKPRYTFMPLCAYECGAYMVERSGDLKVEDGADMSIVQILLDEGLITGEIVEVDTDKQETVEETEPAETEDADEVANEADDADEDAEEASEETLQETMQDDEPSGITISMPMANHSVDSLRRLVNLIYSRGPLLTKSTGGTFGCEKELLTALDEAGIVKMEDFIRLVNEHGGLIGLTFDDGKVNFTGFPMTEDPDKVKAFTDLVSLMNRHAITMKRIQAKEVNDENEKYAMRIWLLRVGMNTDEYKTTRKVLMENLTGHMAFRTKAEEEKWKERQKAKREELKAAKAAAQAEEASEEVEEDE